MKVVLLACIAMLYMSAPNWESNFENARIKSKTENKTLLLNFSGSDWCIPCIRMHKEIFDSEEFKSIADKDLVLYNADFPRKKKNALPAAQRMQNDSIASLYNPEGKFPFTALISPDGKILKSWEGYPAEGNEKFLAAVKSVTHDLKQ